MQLHYPESRGLKLNQLLTLDNYLEGSNLDVGARELIVDKEDIWKISLIDNIPLNLQQEIGYSVTALDRRHYASQHAIWMHGEKHFLGMKLGRNPTDCELVEDFQKTHVPERFRLFYLLNSPEKMALADREINGRTYLLYDFLNMAEQISGINYINKFMKVKLVLAFPERSEDYSI